MRHIHFGMSAPNRTLEHVSDAPTTCPVPSRFSRRVGPTGPVDAAPQLDLSVPQQGTGDQERPGTVQAYRCPVIFCPISRASVQPMPTDVPGEWVAALAAVALDLRCRRRGRAISFQGLSRSSALSPTVGCPLAWRRSRMTQIWANSQSVAVTRSRRRLGRRWCGLPKLFTTN
jgi:hypothetical protein